MLRAIVFAAAVAVVAGCEKTGPTGTVNGVVTVDGQPLADGTVRFVPTDGQSPTAAGLVKDGRFRLPVPVGRARVEFSAPKPLGKKKVYDTPTSPWVEVTGERLPARFNVKSELTLAVSPGTQDAAFELKSK